MRFSEMVSFPSITISIHIHGLRFRSVFSAHFSFFSFLATINHIQRISVTRAKEESWYVLSRSLCYVMAFSHNFVKLFFRRDFMRETMLKFAFKKRLRNLLSKCSRFPFVEVISLKCKTISLQVYFLFSSWIVFLDSRTKSVKSKQC